MWDRAPATPQSAGNVLNTTVSTTIWDPTSVIAGAQDLRLTLMRLLVDGALSVTLAGGTAAIGDIYLISTGIAMVGPSESGADPSLGSAAAEHEDWLWLHHDELVITAGASPFIFPLSNLLIRNLENQTALLDVRAKRKVDQDQVIKISIRVTSPDIVNGHAPATAVVNHQLFSSVLYQRTGR